MVSRFMQVIRITSVLVIAVSMSFVSLAGAQKSLPNGLTKRVVADYGYWSKYQVPAYGAAQIPYREVTHINHAGVGFDASGALSVPDGFIEPELNSMAHAAGVKVMLLLGGDFPGLEASGMKHTLVDNVAAFEKQYGYDGVDLDWEYPESAGDRFFLAQLVAQLRASNPDYVLSIDAAPWGGYGYDLQAFNRSLDYVNIMMYDCAGPWTQYGQLNSPIFWDQHDPAPWECQPGGSAFNTANLFLTLMPGSKLNLGTPFYGYKYLNIKKEFGICPNSAWTPDEACDNAVTSAGYAGYKPMINQRGWHTMRDPIALVPYMLKDDGSDGYVTYDDATSTYYRVWYADWVRGFGGTFLWSLDADYDGHSQDLMDAMYSASLSH
ncbi:MAG: glycosyl hydrolase family 18 protein [Candidatus Sulfotelmatobacter sp.]